MRVFLLLNFVALAYTQCSRKIGSDVGVDLEAKPPSQLPPDHFIQSTFIYRNLDDDDQLFSSAVSNEIATLRERLRQKARLSIDNENIDCTKDEFPRCREFPSREAYHFLIVEDSSKGAAIYSIDRKLNADSNEKIEMALLDAFSRHSKVPLMEFGSQKADTVLGFVRELTNEEIQQFEAERIKKSKKKTRRPIYFTRSPFELDLIEPHILEFRMADFPEADSPALQVLDKEDFDRVINENQFVFVLFWTNG
uniref:Thioredoxin domain-containing protein n=1 Tax=Steinernema glaseri TaxID=37863 RepID=A0A1I7ZQP1_9BILA